MTIDPLNRYSRAAIAEGAAHFQAVADGQALSGKAARKAEKRLARDDQSAAEIAGEAEVMAQLDRRAGALGATRSLVPARIVQGRATAAEMPVESRGDTQADVDDLRARMAADEASERAQAERPRQTRSQTVNLPPQRRTGGFVV